MHTSRWIRVVCLTTLAHLLGFGGLAAQSCKSAAQIVSNVWNEYDQVAMQVGCAGAAAGVTVASGGAGLPAAAGMYAECLGKADEANEISRALVGFWNDLANNKSLTIGPRKLELGETHQGIIRGPGTRLFVTEPLRGDKLSLGIKKLRFRGKTDVKVCKFPPAGPGHGVEGEEILSYTFDPGLGNKGALRLNTLSDVGGRVVTVLLNGRSAVKSMKYELSAELDDLFEIREDRGRVAAEDEQPAEGDEPGDGPDLIAAAAAAAATVRSRAVPYDEFVAIDRRMLENGMRIADIEYAGGTLGAVWRPGTGEQRWHTGVSAEELGELHERYVDRLRLVDIELGPEGYTAVWREGQGPQEVTFATSRGSFRDRDAEYFDRGLRLVDIEVWDGRYAGIWRAGDGAQWWRDRMTLEEFQEADARHFENGLELADIEKTADGYVAVWRPLAGDVAQYWATDMSLETFADRHEQHRRDGLVPTDLELIGDGYLAVWRPGSERVEIRVTPDRRVSAR